MTAAYYMFVVGRDTIATEHTTLESAEAEAVRVLRKNGGGKALVVALVSEIVQAKAVFPEAVVTTREKTATTATTVDGVHYDDAAMQRIGAEAADEVRGRI